MRSQLFSPAFRGKLGGYRVNEVFERHAARAGTDDPLALVQYLDLKTYLVGDINTKVDRASMAHSLEVREPLMDHPLVEWLATLPNDAQGAGAGRQVRAQEGDGAAPAARDHVPAEDGLRGAAGALVPRPAASSACATACSARRSPRPGIFDRKVLQHLVEAHQTGTRDYSAPLWTTADVRVVPAQRRWPAASRQACARRDDASGSCTSSTTRFRCTAATRSGRSRS